MVDGPAPMYMLAALTRFRAFFFFQKRISRYERDLVWESGGARTGDSRTIKMHSIHVGKKLSKNKYSRIRWFTANV